MNTFIKISAFLFLSIAFSGCLDMTTKVILKPDGSGTIEETTLMSEEAIKMLSSFSGDSTGQAFEIFSQEELIKKAATFGKDVKFVSSEKIERNGMKGIKAIFVFNDVSKINLEGYSDNEMGGNDEEEKPDDETIKFAFEKGSPSTLEIIMPKPKESSEAEEQENASVDSSAAQMMEGLKNMLSKIKMAVYFEIDGKIIDTDASYRDGNEITLVKLDFKNIFNDPKVFEKFKYASPKTLTEIEELVKDIPGIEIELKEKVFVKFE
ncbi:MAG: hypothetical protein GXO87_07660 [Chlorobi bacterium]|nr:hypothetical protein [Chlorobiota bacterium]